MSGSGFSEGKLCLSSSVSSVHAGDSVWGEGYLGEKRWTHHSTPGNEEGEQKECDVHTVRVSEAGSQSQRVFPG